MKIPQKKTDTITDPIATQSSFSAVLVGFVGGGRRLLLPASFAANVDAADHGAVERHHVWIVVVVVLEVQSVEVI